MPINLHLFTSSERPAFFLDGFTYATNGRIALRIPGRFEDTPDWSKVSTTEGNVWKPQSQTVEKLRAFFQNPPLPFRHSVAECFKPVGARACPVCNGDSTTPFQVFKVEARLELHVVATNVDSAHAIARNWFETGFDPASADSVAYDATQLTKEERRRVTALTAEKEWADIGPDATICPACRGLGKDVPMTARSIDGVVFSQFYLARIATLDGARISLAEGSNESSDTAPPLWFSAESPSGQILGRLMPNKRPAMSDWREPLW